MKDLPRGMKGRYLTKMKALGLMPALRGSGVHFVFQV